MMSFTFNDAEGRPVLAADTAEDLGEVKGFVVDPTATRIAGIHVAGRGRKADVLPWSSIKTFGDDAMVAEAADETERVSDEHEREAAKGNIVLRGAMVLTTTGFEDGKVDDVRFDPESGEITEVITDHGRVAASRLRALGSHALIVDPDPA